MSNQLELEARILNAGNSIEPVVRAMRWRLEQAWREVYARGTYSRTGKWKIPGFEWHVFSSGDSVSKSGARALEFYCKEHPIEFYVWPEETEDQMYRCKGGALPLFTESAIDVYVFPVDLSWTMAFTHEVTWDLGPYFARSEWQVQANAV